MTISVVCSNGHRIKAKEKLAGKKVKCPKCGSIVAIPAVAPEKAGNVVPPLNTLDDTPASDSLPPLEELPSDGGLASLDDLPSDQEFDVLADAPVAVGLSATEASTVSSGRPERENKSLAAPTPILWGVAACGFLAVLVLVVLAGWLIMGGDDDSDVAVAETPPAVSRQVPQEKSAEKPEPAEPPKEEPSVPMGRQKQEAEPATKPNPIDRPEPNLNTPGELVAVDCDPRIAAFRLPAPTWAAAYDQATGRIAVTHDQLGVLLYGVEDLLAGRLSPVAEIATQSVPTAVCQKSTPRSRVWVVAEQGAPKVRVFDADSLQEVGEVALAELLYVNFLTASPNDSFVYYVTQQTVDEYSVHGAGSNTVQSATADSATRSLLRRAHAGSAFGGRSVRNRTADDCPNDDRRQRWPVVRTGR